MAKTKKSGSPQKGKRRSRGKPFVAGDPRINRAGVSKEQAAVQELVRQTAVAVLTAVPDDQKHDILTRILLRISEQAVSGSLPAAEFLLKCAGWKPASTVEVSGPGGGAVVVDIDSAVARRAKEKK